MLKGGHYVYSDPPVGANAKKVRAAPVLAELKSQATTPEQKEMIDNLEKSIEDEAGKDAKKLAEDAKKVPEGLEVHPQGYLCIPCTEAEGNPTLFKNLAGASRHIAGGVHKKNAEAYA